MLKTSLNEFHRECGAKLVDFAGWEMPVMYRGIIDEHLCTRQAASLFDVSHMGRLEIRGDAAERFLQRLCTRNVTGMKVGLSRYSHLCNESGGILDDIIVSRFASHFLIVCNASNRDKVIAWLRRHAGDFGVSIDDRTLETAMVAIQGPQAIPTLKSMLPLPIDELKRYHFLSGELMDAPYAVFRSGYSGEDGVEVVMPAALAPSAVRLLLARAEAAGSPIKPAGLGARDTLRLEAAMPLYGHELTEAWDSITAGQAWCVDLTQPFIGQPVLKQIQERGPARKLAGFELAGRRIARQGCRILQAGREVGVVTSGTQSPTLGKVIAMGLIEAALAGPGQAVEMDVSGTAAPATVVPLPFYKRQRA
ncbi:MAG: Aminomethyltransferase [Phycisphaerae bacterium]|nr:Aminomethyltransferase [Phycisphaerae bacterium]